MLRRAWGPRSTETHIREDALRRGRRFGQHDGPAGEAGEAVGRRKLKEEPEGSRS